jgi:fructose-1,6-bisphosphatase/inositol monophosphatase family enzyme
MQLPEPLAASPYARRLEVAIAAVRAAGAALMELRGSIRGEEANGGQLKTSTDLAAEGWVLGFLQGSYPDELYLAEERHERSGMAWPGADVYWTIDALDGTRSYVEGYPGFCVQVAFVDRGVPRLGVIGEPVTRSIYVAAEGAGAWKLDGEHATRLTGSSVQSVQSGLRFVDSTRPGGPIGALFDQHQGRFVECGSVGLKIVRVVEDAADVYAKRFTYKLWDVAPGEVLLREVGAALGTWQGEPIDYAGAQTHYKTVLAAPRALYAEVVGALGSGDFSE